MRGKFIAKKSAMMLIASPHFCPPRSALPLPMSTLRGLSHARIEGIARIQLLVERLQIGFRRIEMAYVVLCRVFSTTLVQKRLHRMLHRQAIAALAHDVILMEDVTEEMPVVQLQYQLLLNGCR